MGLLYIHAQAYARKNFDKTQFFSDTEIVLFEPGTLPAVKYRFIEQTLSEPKISF